MRSPAALTIAITSLSLFSSKKRMVFCHYFALLTIWFWAWCSDFRPMKDCTLPKWMRNNNDEESQWNKFFRLKYQFLIVTNFFSLLMRFIACFVFISATSVLALFPCILLNGMTIIGLNHRKSRKLNGKNTTIYNVMR